MARKAKQSSEDDGMIMHPKTYMVDSPDWDPNAPDVELETPGGRKPPRPGGHRRGVGSSAGSAKIEPQASSAKLLLIVVGALVVIAGGALGVYFWLESQTDDTVVAAEALAVETEGAATVPAADAGDELAAEFAAELDRAELEAMYRGHVAATAATLGVEPPTLEQLRQPAVFRHPISHGNPRVLGPGKSLRVGELSLRVKIVQGLSVDRVKVSSKAQHTLLIVENRGEVPLAYRLLARKLAGGKCLTPAIIRYDALVLDPEQRVEISICSGRQSVEIIDLRTLELNELGAVWIRQLPPPAVGLGGLAAKSHAVAEGTPQCTEDAEMLERTLYEGELDWEDVVDFYSRHDCTHYPWPSDYRFRDGEAPAELPVVAPWNPGMSPYDEDDAKTPAL